jgi:hypothetical protein
VPRSWPGSARAAARSRSARSARSRSSARDSSRTRTRSSSAARSSSRSRAASARAWAYSAAASASRCSAACSRATASAQAAGDLLPFPGGVGADLVQVARGGLADPGILGPGILGPGPGRGRALPGLLGVGAGLVAGGLGGPDEVLGLGPCLVGFLTCLLDLAIGAGLRLGDAGGQGGLGLGDRLVPLGLSGADLAGGGLADPGGLGVGLGPGQRGLLEALGGALPGLLAGGLGGLQRVLKVRFPLSLCARTRLYSASRTRSRAFCLSSRSACRLLSGAQDSDVRGKWRH